MKGKKIKILFWAKDEKIIDERDYLLWAEETVKLWWQYKKFTMEELPQSFLMKHEKLKFSNQDIPWYKVSCTAQSVSSATSTARTIKADYENIDPNMWFALWDKMQEKWLTSTTGAYLKNAVKIALSESLINWYYRVTGLLEIMSAIYNSDYVVTWTSNINWNSVRTTWLVTEAWKWSWHAFAIIGWDKKKEIGDYVGGLQCMNSYWADYQDKGCFWIPFDLADKILFAVTREAVIVKAGWSGR